MDWAQLIAALAPVIVQLGTSIINAANSSGSVSASTVNTDVQAMDDEHQAALNTIAALQAQQASVAGVMKNAIDMHLAKTAAVVKAVK